MTANRHFFRGWEEDERRRWGEGGKETSVWYIIIIIFKTIPIFFILNIVCYRIFYPVVVVMIPPHIQINIFEIRGFFLFSRRCFHDYRNHFVFAFSSFLFSVFVLFPPPRFSFSRLSNFSFVANFLGGPIF